MNAKKKSTNDRKAALASTIQGQVVRGARIESQSDFQAVLIKGKAVNHLLHFIVGLFTLGAWWVVWLILVIAGGEERQIVAVDEFGNVTNQSI